MKKALLLLSLASGLYASCNNYNTLGDRVSKGLENLPSIVWHKRGNGFTLEPSRCQKSGYLLLHDNDKKYTKKLYTKNSYTLQRGWNFVHAPKDGVDVAQTFSNPSVLFVYIYDAKTPAWAGYSANKNYRDMMQNRRILDLKYIEPTLGFYVYANKKITLPIASTHRPKSCQKILESGDYAMLMHSAFNGSQMRDRVRGMSLGTLYQSHYRRGIYSDTRVELFYPKDIKIKKDAKALVYGTIEPRFRAEYAKEYQEQKFYVADYFTKECYEGIFPSKRVPPFPILKKLQNLK